MMLMMLISGMTLKLFLHGLTCELEIDFFSSTAAGGSAAARLRRPPAAVSADI